MKTIREERRHDAWLSIPTMTTTARNAMTTASAPRVGTIIHNSTTGRTEWYNGSGWNGVAILGDLGNATSFAGVALGALMAAPNTSDLIQYNGTNWSPISISDMLAPTTYTPTLTQSSTVTKTVNRARYITIGKLCMLWVQLTPTAGGSAGTAITVGLPNTAQNSAQGIGAGSITLGGTAYRCTVHLVSTTTVQFKEADVTGTANMGATPNVGLASSGDLITFFAVYEVA